MNGRTAACGLRHTTTVVLLALVLAIGGFVLPAQARAPADLEFDLQITYAEGTFTSVNGVWSSKGLVEDSGDAVQAVRHAGWPPDGGFFRAAHSVTTLTTAGGAIMLQDQLTVIEWSVPDFSGSGSWVIQDATGVYSRLHGQGTSTLAATYHPACPDPSAPAACIILDAHFVGSAHFE